MSAVNSTHHHEEIAEEDVLLAVRDAHVVAQRLDQEGEHRHAQRRNAHHQGDVEIAVMAVHDGADVPRAVEGLVGVEQHLRTPEAVVAVAEPWLLGEHLAGELPQRHAPGIGEVGKIGVGELLQRIDEDDAERGERRCRPWPAQTARRSSSRMPIRPGSTTIMMVSGTSAGRGLGAGVGHEDHGGHEKKQRRDHVQPRRKR